MAYQKTFAIRFFFSASTNLIRGALNFVTGLLIARWLGPSEFGVLAFLLATFLALRQLVDPGVSSAFFTMLSERQKPILFVLYFFGWLGFQLIMATIILLFVLPDTFIAKVWPGEDRWLPASWPVVDRWPSASWSGVDRRLHKPRRWV